MTPRFTPSPLRRTSSRLGGRPLVWLLAGLLLLLAWDASGLDLTLSRHFGNASGFAWRHAWWAQQLLHDGGKWLAWAVMALLLVDAWRPVAAGPSRAERSYWSAVVLASALLVPGLKRLSATSCPWDLAEFGGHAAYVPHWLPGVADGGAGHCFPSGHAVSAFAFFGMYFLWQPTRPGLARAFMVLTLLLGGLAAVVQLVRGAHFMSHSLWSAWLCASIAVAAQGLRRWQLRRSEGGQPAGHLGQVGQQV